MSRQVSWERRAVDELRAIAGRDRRQAERISHAVERFADNDQGDVRKLAGSSDEYRLRVGDWRVLFRLEDGGRLVVVARVLNRRDAYR